MRQREFHIVGSTQCVCNSEVVSRRGGVQRHQPWLLTLWGYKISNSCAAGPTNTAVAGSTVTDIALCTSAPQGIQVSSFASELVNSMILNLEVLSDPFKGSARC